MNRRKAIFAMLCCVAGRRMESQEITSTAPITALYQEPLSFYLDLKQITKFVFHFGDKQVELTGEEIWKELHGETGEQVKP